MNLLGALCGLGDLIAQTAIDKKSFDAIEWSRVGRFAFIGATLIVRDLFLVLLLNLVWVQNEFGRSNSFWMDLEKLIQRTWMWLNPYGCEAV